MRDAADEPLPQGSKQCDELVVRVALVQEHRLAYVCGQLELRRKGLPLRGTRRIVAKKVEPAFADGDECRVAEQRAQRGRRVLVEFGCVMGVDAGRCEQRSRSRLAERRGLNAARD